MRVNQANVPLWLDIQAGTPYYYAVMVDSTSFSSASWSNYTSSNITANLGGTEGWHTVWVGLCDLLGGVPTWYPVRMNLDWTAPRLVITNPTASTVSVPVMQLLGYSPEALSSISYGLSNAVGVVTNQQALVTDQYYDLGHGQFTTNYFACLDIPLTNGLNTITLRAADLAGNLTVTNFSFTLDYSGVTAPTVQIAWPADGSLVSGTSFTCRGWISDPTATVATSAVDGNGYTNVYTGVVGRDGNFWLENLPLNAGTNVFSISVTDVAGSNTVTNISVVQSAVSLTMNDVSLDPQLWQPTINLTGTISDSSYTVWVNGVSQGTTSGTNWSANNVPVPAGPNASFAVAAYAPGQTQPGGADNQTPEYPRRVYVASYVLTNSYNLTNWSFEFVGYWLWYVMTTTDTNIVNWTDGTGGSGNKTDLEVTVGNYYNTNYSAVTHSLWPASSWPYPAAGTSTAYVNGNFYTNTTSAPPIIFEHCDASVPVPNQTGSNSVPNYSIGMKETGSRYAQATIKLWTGGKPGSTAQNLFVISCSATNMPLLRTPPWSGWDPSNGSPTPIAPTNIAIGDLGYLGADSNLYVVLPDNKEVNITPTVRGAQYFTFGAANGDPVAAQKYAVQIQAVTNGVTNTLDSSVPTKFCVGQYLQFQLACLPVTVAAPALTWLPRSYGNWILPDKYVSRITTNGTNASATYAIDTNLLTAFSTHCWYVNGPGGRLAWAGRLYFINGQSTCAAASAQIAIHVPIITNYTPYPPYFVTNNAGELALGCMTSFPQGGFIHYDVDIYSEYPGHMDVAQLINRNVSAGGTSDGSTSGQYWLDHTFPYCKNPLGALLVPYQGPGYAPLTLTDSPGVMLAYSIPWYMSTSIADSVMDYVMFIPSGQSNIWVTLGITSWSWWANAQYSILNGWAPPNGNVTPPARPTNSDAFPQWTQVKRD